MTTFTLNNGHTFMKKDNGYCYAIVKNTKTRIALPVFNANYEQFVKEENERQNAENLFTNIDAKEQFMAEFDAAAENDGVTLEEFCRMVQDAEPVEEPKQPKAKKERKPRKSKDIAYKGNGVTLTAKQVDFIKHLSDTCFWENGLDSQIWCDILADEIRGQFAGKPMTVGAMLSTICEKGLGVRCKDRVNGKKATSFALTELGKLVAAELGLH